MIETARGESLMWDLELVAPGVHRVLPAPDVSTLESALDLLAEIDGAGDLGRGSDIGRVDVIALLERLKGAAAAAQARVTARFEESQLHQQDAEIARAQRRAAESADAGEAGAAQRRARRLTRERGRGIGDQVALARCAQTSQGSRFLGFARAMGEMPHTHELLAQGRISEWAATILVRESAVLTVEDRAQLDEELCAWHLEVATGEIEVPRVFALSHAGLERSARGVADRLDPEAAVRRRAKSEAARRVTIRPTPDTMVHLTGLLPVAQGVAAFANLQESAKKLKAGGDERSVSQIMADLLVTRLTGQEDAEVVPVEIGLVMHPGSLAGADDRPARTRDAKFDLPADVVRAMADHPGAPTWLRRLWTDPSTGVVVDVDTQRRVYDPAAAGFVAWRDQTCRHPGCERPIGVVDHALRHADGGPTTRANAQGLCPGHNLVKEMPGWRTRVSDPRPGRHEVETITPTGHVYRSQAPPAMPPPA
ncbi:MAG: HNH endonuclease [Nocardioides sp.]|nr:HNH endonuclease [Nocardioides sp.]